MNARPDLTTFLPMTPALRRRLEATVEQLIALLDEVDGDTDLEPNNDNEPMLGWVDRGPYAWEATDDREAEDEHDEDGGDREPDVDDEPDAPEA